MVDTFWEWACNWCGLNFQALAFSSCQVEEEKAVVDSDSPEQRLCVLLLFQQGNAIITYHHYFSHVVINIGTHFDQREWFVFIRYIDKSSHLPGWNWVFSFVAQYFLVKISTLPHLFMDAALYTTNTASPSVLCNFIATLVASINTLVLWWLFSVQIVIGLLAWTCSFA